MKKGNPYLLSVAISAVLCAVALFLPMGSGALWQRPCVNVYSVFAAAFFVMNTVGLIAAAKAGMSRIAFVKYDSEKCIEEIKKLGVKNMFDDMRLVKKFLIEKFLK